MTREELENYKKQCPYDAMGDFSVFRVKKGGCSINMEGKEVEKIRIPRKPYQPTNRQGLIRITPEAADALDEVTRETTLSTRQVASIIILEAIRNGLIEFTDGN